MSFSSILGQEKTVKRLRALIESGRVPPALIFLGQPGVGKFQAAIEFAKALNCSHVPHREKPSAPPPPDPDDLFAAAAPPPPPPEPEPEPEIHGDRSDSCGTCLSCLQSASGAHPDIRVIDKEMQAALLSEDESANLKTDTMREMIRWVQQKPMLSPWKAFIVRDAETMMPQAQNAILKTLEEPPKGTVVILTVSRKTSLLSTIISRSTIIDFPPLSREALRSILESQGAEPGQAAALAALSGGSLEKAAEAAAFLKRIAALRPGDPARAFRFAAGLPRGDSHKARDEVKTLLELILQKGRKAWRDSAGADKKRLTALLRRTMDLRRMADRNVSYLLLLETALLESERAGLRLEDLVKANPAQ